MDACHSGEVDKDEVTVTKQPVLASNENSKAKISFRGFGNVKSKSELGLGSSFELMKQLFADLRRGSGAVVIASASGVEYAIESDTWQNGIFTYSIIDGLQSKKADANRNGEVTVSELLNYTSKRVIDLTNGKQHPTSRRENLDFDFVVWW